MSALKQWENMACLGLHIGSTLDQVLGGGGIASLVKDSPQKALSSPEESEALASVLVRVLSEGIKHTTGLFSRLQANCLLARREVLASSTLPEWDRTTLRSLPSNSLEFFGQKLRPFSQLGRRRSSKMAWCKWLWFPPSLLA